MTKAELMADLYGYRELCAQIDMLNRRLQQAEREYNLFGDGGISGAQLRSPLLTGMPTARNSTSSPTERTAMDRMSFSYRGADLEVMTELQALINKKELLDIALRCLRDRERLVIMSHLVGGQRWRETARHYAQEFGDELTETGLKYVMRQGLERMLKVLL